MENTTDICDIVLELGELLLLMCGIQFVPFFFPEECNLSTAFYLVLLGQINKSVHTYLTPHGASLTDGIGQLD